MNSQLSPACLADGNGSSHRLELHQACRHYLSVFVVIMCILIMVYFRVGPRLLTTILYIYLFIDIYIYKCVCERIHDTIKAMKARNKITVP